jgi:hypothetical protein
MNEAQKWQEAHAALVELARERAGTDFEEGYWLLAAKRSNAHRQLGYGSFNEYIGRLFGYAARVTYDKVRVARALEQLPELSRELRDGSLNFSQVRELTRVATPETEAKWLESARGRTVHEVEKLVSGHRPGSLPDAPKEPALERHVLRFEVTGETLASFREAVARLRADAGEHLDDDTTLLQMARLVLGGPADDGRASYQVALDVCEDCQCARQIAHGEAIVVSPTLVAMASCDAQRLPRAHMGNEVTERLAKRGAGGSARGAAARTSSLSGARLPARHVRRHSSCRSASRRRRPRRGESRHVVRCAPSRATRGHIADYRYGLAGPHLLPRRRHALRSRSVRRARTATNACTSGSARSRLR